MMQTERFPLDFETLNRGDVIPAERIEAIYGVSRHDAAYRFRAMGLAEQVEDHFRLHRGEEVLVKHDHDSLRLLTHREQSIEARRRAAQAVGQYARCVTKMAGVDIAQLPDEERPRHERSLQVMSFRYQQLRKPAPPLLGEAPAAS